MYGEKKECMESGSWAELYESQVIYDAELKGESSLYVE